MLRVTIITSENKTDLFAATMLRSLGVRQSRIISCLFSTITTERIRCRNRHAIQKLKLKGMIIDTFV
ncbi:uncharacterized protein ARMOST_18466 [Armillaria ostoyae]|uniref:Uncharacterized protein n=1 Tax=Armillaria ostoyae TaxID=47428 RepID=A0A284S1Y7_ARMOS|nr:uncharacterized protein ARMOST_18466 [Armillaria ostoyae]